MSVFIRLGATTWEGGRDAEGHREYKITFRVSGSTDDGPANVIRCPGLPYVGSTWNFGYDFDIWAWCRSDAKAKPMVTGEPNTEWTVEYTFSTKPLSPNSRQGCGDEKITDPLLEPQKITGSFVKYQKEAAFDRFGLPVLNSSWEQLKGAEVTFDSNRPQVKIEQNVAVLNLGLCGALVDSVNILPMWGVGSRMVKLTDFEWERKLQGVCSYYFTRKFTFDIDLNTFDRYILDEGSKCLNGKNVGGAWKLMPVNGAGLAPNPSNPLHFIRYKDANGENARCILDGAGKPLFTSLEGSMKPVGLSWSAGAGGEVTVVFATPHKMKRGQRFTISGVLNHTGYNGTYIQLREITNPNNLVGNLATDPGIWSSTTDKGLVTFLSYGEAAPGQIFVSKYLEADLFQLGIPALFG